MTITAARAVTIAWLQNWWEPRSRARELARQYRAMTEACPSVIADLARFCLAHDSTFVQGDPDASQINVGKREVWLHIQEMLHLTPDDLRKLKEDTERE